LVCLGLLGSAAAAASIAWVAWPPTIGEPLPGATDGWYEQPKWSEWILSPRGHGPEWRTILALAVEDADALWEAIAAAIVGAPVYGVRVAPTGGVLCEVRFEITLRGRIALAITVWHLASEGAAPRLVTAYPRPYTR
jgi:hypothetical protein